MSIEQETVAQEKTKSEKIIEFDQTHIPSYKTKAEYLDQMPPNIQRRVVLQFPIDAIPKEYQDQALDYCEGKETALQIIQELKKEDIQVNHENAYRISLIKNEKEDLTAVLLKKEAEWEEEIVNGKEIPEIVVTSSYQAQVGAPIPINEFLGNLEKETLAETLKENDKKEYLIDSVYDRTEEGLQYHSSRIQDENNKEQANFFSIKNNTLMPMADRYEELEAILQEANEELIDKDKYEFSDGGIVFDTNIIGDANHASAIKSARIQQAGAAEQERLEWGRDTNNKGPAVLDAIRDDDVSDIAPPKQMYYSEFYNMEQDVSKLSGEREAMEQEVKEEMEDQVREEPPEQPQEHMSYRERIEAEDRDFWEEDLVREY